jgi:capsular polysaccharide biosynthesis protein
VKRYAESFFRYWYIVLAPIFILPIATFVLLGRGAAPTTVSMNVWASPASIKVLGTADLTFTPAQNMMNDFQQLLAIKSFDRAVARNSPLFLKLAKQHPDPANWIQSELRKNVSFTPTGPNLVTISYKAKDAGTGREVLKSIAALAPDEVGALNRTYVAPSTIRLADEPNGAPSVSSKKQMVLDFGIALLVGAILGIGFLAVKTALDGSVRYSDEVPDLLGLPVLGIIPMNQALIKPREAR